MKRLKFLGLLVLILINILFAEEYISNEHLEEIYSKPEVIADSLEHLPIAKTVEEEAKDEEKKRLGDETVPIPAELEDNTTLAQEELVFTPLVKEKQSIEKNSYLNALKQARDENKIIMLTIRSTDCKYCDEMEENTLSDSSVKEVVKNNFISIHYNQDLDTLPLGLQEGMTPNFIFVNTNEDILNMYPGMRTPAEFKEVLEQILAM